MAAAQEQLKKRMKRASRARRSDYARLHEVRKAGKRVDIRHDEHRHEERQRALPASVPASRSSPRCVDAPRLGSATDHACNSCGKQCGVAYRWLRILRYTRRSRYREISDGRIPSVNEVTLRAPSPACENDASIIVRFASFYPRPRMKRTGMLFAPDYAAFPREDK